jgi:hypothetical protein
MPFQRWCQKHDLDFSDYSIPDSTVIEIDRDHFCPSRKRTVLYRGAVYESPVYLYGFRFKKNIGTADNFIAGVIEEALEGVATEWKKAEKRHRELIEMVTRRLKVEYYRKEDSISIDGVHIIKNISARIFRYMVRHYCTSRRQNFSLREFTREKSIARNSGDSNLALRMQRLIETLDRKTSLISIQRTSRGHYLFKSCFRIEYTEKQ